MTEHFGRYELVRHLATGGMGEVYLARQVGPAGFVRTVVVKRLLPHLAKDQAFIEMFLNEARVVATLSHPNIGQLLELGEAGGTYFIALEYIHGRSLLQVEKALATRERVLSPAVAARVLVQALRGVECAHALRIDGKPAPVIHRDLSPDNILIGFNGLARVIDFGIARASGTVSTTRTGTLKGKFAYMAPERFDADVSREVDPRTDVYAMGVVAYEALGGVRPFRGRSDAALIGAILKGIAQPLEQLNPSVPGTLSALVMQALSSSPEQRFQTAGAFADALEAWAREAGALVSDAEVAALLRGLFGAEADDSPALTPSPHLAPVDVPLETVSSLQPAVRRRRGPVLAGAALVVVAGLALGLWPRAEPMVSRPAPPVAALVAPVAPDASVHDEPKPTPKPAGKPGRVSFRVKPWAEIWLGDEKLGVTPNVRVERPPGDYVFSLRNPDFPPRALRVQVMADSDVSVKVDLTTP